MTAIPRGVALPATFEIFQPHVESFKAWLVARGSEIYPCLTNNEVMRFSTMQGVAVIQQKNITGKLSWPLPAGEAFLAYRTNDAWRGNKRHKRRKMADKIDAVRLRDGDDCFYCGEQCGADVTPEHLVSLTCGGSNHLANIVLAHEDCNKRAGHLSVFEKIKLREQMHRTKTI